MKGTTSQTAVEIARLVTLISAVSTVSANSIPVISGHEQQDLDARISEAVSGAAPGLFVAVTAVSGKNLTPTSRQKSPVGVAMPSQCYWQNSFRVEIAANPTIQTPAVAALDLMELVAAALQGAPYATARNDRFFSVGEWTLEPDEPSGLLVYALTVTQQT